MAAQLTPILGTYAGILFSLGLWAAAFSSGVYQITLASRFLNEAIGKEIDVKAPRSRIVMVLASLHRFPRSEEHTSELQSRGHLVCRLLLEKKKKTYERTYRTIVKTGTKMKRNQTKE